MRFASFCALAGTALLAGGFVSGESAVDVEGLDIEIGEDASDLAAEVPSISSEELEGLTLSKEDEAAIASATSQGFETEVNRMMKLIINSIYKKKEIFLRELISNASDALDKIRFKALTDSTATDGEELRVRIRADRTNGVLHIEDTGVGMTRDELTANLGTIAKSGTSEFMEAVEAGAGEASSLIGQFGVGFYSAFLVADKITVTSKADADHQHVWTSDSTSFSVIRDPRGNTIGRGTRISLYLKDDSKEFLEPSRLSSLVHEYSEFIDFPIYQWSEVEVAVETDVADEGDEDEDEGEEDFNEDDDEDGEVEDDDDDEEEEEEQTELVWKYEHMNPQKPIWTRDPKEVTAGEYTAFYNAFQRKDSGEALAHTHFTAEAEVGFRSILYLPSAEYGMATQSRAAQAEAGSNIKLFVRRVYITEDLGDFFPSYLWFIKGLVDSDDLPLTVSRENLQEHKLLKVIKKKVTKKALDMMKDLGNEDENKYLEFYEAYHSNLKMGVIEDSSNQKRLAELLRFRSNKSEEVQPLKTYVENMKEGQDSIYFIAEQSVADCENSPFIEKLNSDGYEILFMTDPIDEYMIQSMGTFSKQRFVDVRKEGLKFDEKTEGNIARKEYFEELANDYESTAKFFSDSFDFIGKVKVSSRLEQAPCALVASEYGWSGNMERLMASQPTNGNDPMADFYKNQPKTLEINPRHPLIKKLRSLVDTDTTDATTKDLAAVLVDTAVIRSGYPIADQPGFAARMEFMLRLSLGVDPAEEIDAVPEFEDNPEIEEDEGDNIDDIDADDIIDTLDPEDHDEL